MELSEGRKTEPEPVKKVIGLTGGIGSGKSTVSKFIEELGYPVYYSDTKAKIIVNKNEHLKKDIIQLLGKQSYDENGLYNRKYVSEIVFNNEELLNQLNQLIPPAVQNDFKQWSNSQTSEYLFKETALLFELNLEKDYYKSVLVTAEDNLRIKRVMDRDQKTYREVESVMNNQLPEKEKIKKADFIIYNNGGLEELKEETQRILNNLISG